MARARRKVSLDYPYHINAACINHEWFKIPIEEVWEVFCDYLYLVKYAFNLEIHSFVLMSNHFHLILRTPEGNLSEAMNYFMREVSREISRKSDRTNQVFGGPYHASLITNSIYYLHAYKYVYRNPVEAGMCVKVEDYKYSTLHGLIGSSKLIIPVFLDETLFSSFEETMGWLNLEYKKDHKEKIRKALKKKVYKLAVKTSNRKPDELERCKS